MTFMIPFGGFLAARVDSNLLSEKVVNLKETGAVTFCLEKERVVMAAWQQFEGQGIWQNDQCLISYDIQLSNEKQLRAIVDDDPTTPVNKGKLLWMLYRKFGRGMLHKLRGGFAFSLWDNFEKKLIVVTDFYGIRPVVYTYETGSFAAASRIKHLLWAGFDPGGIYPDAIFHYLFFQAICTPLTIYSNFKKLEPGTAVFLNEDDPEFSLYYDIRYQTVERNDEDYWCERIFSQVEKAVKVYAGSLPIEKTGCFLSGGTDSSSVAGLYTKIAARPVNTFSIGFDDPTYNEMEYAHAAVQRFGTTQHDYFVTPEDVLVLIDKLAAVYDEPFGNASVVPAYYCADLAAETGMAYMLGGDGGDEIFGGNERYVTNLVFQRYLDTPALLRKALLEPLLSCMPSKHFFYRAKRYVRRANIRNPERFYSYNLLAETGLSMIFTDDFLDRVDAQSFMNLAKHHYNNAAPAHDTNRLMYLDMKFTITDNDLRKVTQMVEAAGIQVCYPLLEKDLVDFAAGIPPRMKVKWGKNRYIFKKAMSGFLPDEIIQKKKHGMGLPVAPWFKTDKKMSEYLYDNLFSGRPEIEEYIRTGFIGHIKKSFEQDTTPYYADNLWVLLILEIWAKQQKQRSDNSFYES